MKTGDKLRKAYHAARLDLGLTLRGAAEALGMTPSELSRLEHGPTEPLERYDFEAELHCHRCHQTFVGRPVKEVAFPAYVCPTCKEKSDVG